MLKSALEKRVHALHPEKVRLLPYQPKERLAESLTVADLHLVPLRRGVYACLVPSKAYVTDVESARDNPSGELTGRRQRSC